MTEIARKICMLGDFGVGKTSLVSRYVRNSFSDKYLTTVGVKVDSKVIETESQAVKLVLWDIAGKSALDSLNQTYIRGASGLILVADGTREPTFRAALYLLMQARSILQNPSAVLLVNKLDLVEQWEIPPQTISDLRQTLPVFETSAKSGIGVEEAFLHLAKQIVHEP